MIVYFLDLWKTVQTLTKVILYHIPWKASCLHVIGQGYIMWPHIKLPLAKSDNTTEHVSRMYTHSHVDVHSSGLSYLPERV